LAEDLIRLVSAEVTGLKFGGWPHASLPMSCGFTGSCGSIITAPSTACVWSVIMLPHETALKRQCCARYLLSYIEAI